MEADYQNKMIGAKGYTRLKKRYDLPSGAVWYKDSVVDLDKYPELRDAVNAKVVKKKDKRQLAGYQPKEKLKTSPPQGGSGVPPKR